jgi:hypothetical protein
MLVCAAPIVWFLGPWGAVACFVVYVPVIAAATLDVWQGNG